jgi:Fe-S-cluster formation regulator IscX/YfhJ
MADRKRVYEGRPGLAEWGEDLGEVNPRVLRAVRAGAKANVMPSPSGVPFAGLVESTKSLPALPHFLGDLLTGGRYGLSERAPEFALEASAKYDELINKYLAEEGLAESSKLPMLEKYGLAAGEMLGQLPVPGKLLQKVVKKLPKAAKPAGWLAEYFGPTVDPKAINYAVGTGVGGTLRTATGEEPEGYAKGGLKKSPIDKVVSKVVDVKKLGEPSFNVPTPKLGARVAGYHIAQDLPAILSSGAITNRDVGSANMQGFAPSHVGGGYFYSDPQLAAAQRERVLEAIFEDGRVTTDEYPVLKMLMDRKARFAPDEDVGLNIPWEQSFREGSFATLDPVGLDRLLKIYSGDPEVTKDLVRDAMKAQGYAKGGLGRKPIVRATAEGVTEAGPRKSTEIMKEPGGNWLPGSVEQFIDRVRQDFITLGDRPKDRLAKLESSSSHISPNADPNYIAAYNREKTRLEAQVPVDQWLEKKLTNYVKNDMATERDPVRLGIEQRVAKVDADKAKAEQRIAKQQAKIAEAKAAGRDTTAVENRLALEIADLEERYSIDSVRAGVPVNDRYANLNAEDARRVYGKPALATTPQSQNWEDITDWMVGLNRAGDILQAPNQRLMEAIEQAPWLAKVPPETKVYEITGNPDYFNHMRDELFNSLRRDTDLPPELRLKADDLEKMSVDAVVAHTGKIDAWRDRNRIAAELSKSNNPATFTVKQYPGTGLEWKQLKMPEIKELPQIETRQRSATQGEFRVPGDPNWYAANDMGSVGLDFEGKARDLLSTRALREALEYEGGVMGHCVGGYCDPVKAGQKQIFSLRDAKGEPHVTIEVRPKDVSRAVGDLPAEERAELSRRVREELFGDPRANPGTKGPEDVGKFYDLIKQAYVEKYGEPPPDIVQIKGKGNRKPAEKYIPFVQDFVKSGKFGDIGDIENAELMKLGDQVITQKEFAPMREKALQFLSEHPSFEAARRANAEYYNFSGGIPSPEYSAVDRARGVPVAPDIPYTWRELSAILDDPKSWNPDDVSTALGHTRELARRAGIKNFADGGEVNGDYDEREIESIVEPLRQKLERFTGKTRELPLEDYPDPFAEMSPARKLLELAKGAGSSAKYLLTEFDAYADHLQAPEMYARMLRKRYPELGSKRINRGPLDAAINYAGAYDWAARPGVSPEDARSMAMRYQLRDYLRPSRVASNEVADYAQNLAGVEQALADRAAKIKRDREAIAELARKYVQRETEARRVGN